MSFVVITEVNKGNKNDSEDQLYSASTVQLNNHVWIGSLGILIQSTCGISLYNKTRYRIYHIGEDWAAFNVLFRVK